MTPLLAGKFVRSALVQPGNAVLKVDFYARSENIDNELEFVLRVSYRMASDTAAGSSWKGSVFTVHAVDQILRDEVFFIPCGHGIRVSGNEPVVPVTLSTEASHGARFRADSR